MDEANGSPEGYDHATAAKIEQPVECGECGRSIPAGEWLWLFSRGDLEQAKEVKVVCVQCGETLGCGPLDGLDGNGRQP